MTSRQCSPCTACCQGWLTADIAGTQIKPGTPCIHIRPQGCEIYPRRPRKPCVTYRCGWIKYPDILPDNLKPSVCGAIIMLDRKWHERDVIRAVPTGEKIPPDTLEWLMAYSRQTRRPLLFSRHIFKDGRFIAKKKLGYGPPEFIHAVETEIGPEDILMR